MRYLQGTEHTEALQWVHQALALAQQSRCLRKRCSALIVRKGIIIGQGVNAPPHNKKLNVCFKDTIPKDFTSDRTCCVHAEERAIIEALKHHHEKLPGSRLYFIRIDDQGNLTYVGKPYCTICSKLALDVDIKEFVLYHHEGICVYDTEEYNTLSFRQQP